jgi:hypothetical protein
MGRRASAAGDPLRTEFISLINALTLGVNSIDGCIPTHCSFLLPASLLFYHYYLFSSISSTHRMNGVRKDTLHKRHLLFFREGMRCRCTFKTSDLRFLCNVHSKGSAFSFFQVLNNL